jgi:hypothetical protein
VTVIVRTTEATPNWQSDLIGESYRDRDILGKREIAMPSGSKLFDESANVIVISRRKKMENAACNAENKPHVQTHATLEIAVAQSTNAQSGMQMRGAKSGLNRLDHVCDLPTAHLRQLTYDIAKPFGKINLQDPLPSRRCIA